MEPTSVKSTIRINTITEQHNKTPSLGVLLPIIALLSASLRAVFIRCLGWYGSLLQGLNANLGFDRQRQLSTDCSIPL